MSLNIITRSLPPLCAARSFNEVWKHDFGGEEEEDTMGISLTTNRAMHAYVYRSVYS